MRKQLLMGIISIAVITAFLIFPTQGSAQSAKYKECAQKVKIRDWNSALRCIQEFKQERPSWFYPIYLEAKVNLALGKTKEALNSLKEAQELAMGDDQLFPIYFEYTFIYYSRWNGRSDQKEADKWCAQMKSVAGSKRSQQKAYGLCGKIAYKEKDWKGAERELQRAWRLNRRDTDVAELYIKTLQKNGKNRQAIKALERQVKTAPSAALYGLLAETYIKDKRFDEAESIAGKCLKLERTNLKCRVIEADALIGKKEWQKASDAMQKLVLSNPTNWALNMKLGEVYQQKKEFKRAVTYLDQACKRTPRDVWQPFVKLAVAFEQLFVKTKKTLYLENGIVTIDEGYKRCSTCGEVLEVRERLYERMRQIKADKFEEIDCDKQPNHPECKKLEEKERRENSR